MQDNTNEICHAFDSYFPEWVNYENKLGNKTFFIEEFSMVPNKWMTKIYETFKKHRNTAYLFGGPNQYELVEGGSQVHYDYLYWPKR